MCAPSAPSAASMAFCGPGAAAFIAMIPHLAHLKDENEDKDFPCTPVKRSNMTVNVGSRDGSRGSDHANGANTDTVRATAYHLSECYQPGSHARLRVLLFITWFRHIIRTGFVSMRTVQLNLAAAPM
jgi:hypothetical protein